MKILHLVSSGGYYGKESVIVNLCCSLEKLGCSTEVGAFLNSRAPNYEIVVRARRRQLPARTFPCRGRVDVRTVGLIREYIVSQHVGLVHTHDYKANLYGYLAARKAGRPVIATCHLWFATTLLSRIYGSLDRRLLRHFDGVIAVSPTIGEILRKSLIPEGKLAVIANGIDFGPFLGVREGLDCREFGEGPTIGIVGRLTQQKGHAILFTAAGGILKKFPSARFVLVGDGPDRARLEALSQELGIAGSIQFAGFREDMERVYGALDLIVMPSLDEGLPMVLLEAMAAGRAVIATAVGAVPEVIEDAKSGLLVTPGDREELQQAVLSLLGDRSRRQQMGENARASVVRFSSDRMAQNYLGFYERMERRIRVSTDHSISAWLDC